MIYTRTERKGEKLALIIQRDLVQEMIEVRSDFFFDLVLEGIR